MGTVESLRDVLLVLQDWVLFLFHTGLVFFNMLGWIWRRTRVLHLITMGLTAFSWFALGAVYGWGYCFCTDYHAYVLRQLENPHAELTFIQLMLKRLFGVSLTAPVAGRLALWGFVLIAAATCAAWSRELYQGRKRSRSNPSSSA